MIITFDEYMEMGISAGSMLAYRLGPLTILEADGNPAFCLSWEGGPDSGDFPHLATHPDAMLEKL